MKQNQVQQKAIRLGTHGENYGSWMSNPVFYVLGALLALSVVLAVLSFTVFHITVLGVVFVIAAAILLALLLWCAWIRRQYAFGGGTQNGCGFPAPRKVRNYMRTPANTFTLSCGEFFCFWLLL